MHSYTFQNLSHTLFLSLQQSVPYICHVSGPGLTSATVNHPTYIIVELTGLSGRPHPLTLNVTAQMKLIPQAMSINTSQGTSTRTWLSRFRGQSAEINARGSNHGVSLPIQGVIHSSESWPTQTPCLNKKHRDQCHPLRRDRLPSPNQTRTTSQSCDCLVCTI